MSKYFSRTEVLFPVDKKHDELDTKFVSIIMPDGKEHEAAFGLFVYKKTNKQHYGLSSLELNFRPFSFPREYVTPEGLKLIKENPDKDARCRYIMRVPNE